MESERIFRIPPLQPTYVAHPGNMDADEAFAIVFRGPEEGFTTDKGYFINDAHIVARLLAWLTSQVWQDAFAAEFQRACAEVEADSDGIDAADLSEFLGGPVPTAAIELHQTVRVSGVQES